MLARNSLGAVGLFGHLFRFMQGFIGGVQLGDVADSQQVNCT
jgi:hypothetical protein